MLHRSISFAAIALSFSLSLLAATGCVEPPDEPPPALVPSADAAPPIPVVPVFAPGDKDQSRWLLGLGLDLGGGHTPLHHVSVGTAGRDALNNPVTVTFDGGAGLRGVGADGVVHLGADPWFDNVRLPGPAGGELKLDAVTMVNGVVTYGIHSRSAPNQPWTEPCAGLTARVLAGTFTRRGLHEATPGRLTFACMDGVAAKCIDWGYVPGAAAGTPVWRTHQACTRMGRGDYCADGTAHTRTGTYIRTFDALGVGAPVPATWPQLGTWPPPTTDFYFEAAWRPDAPALCLSRLRWQSLPPGPQCAGQLPDPREDIFAKYCDQQSSADLVTLGALVFNTSRYNDIKLESWRSGTDQVATVRGYYAVSGSEIPGQVPFPGYVYTHPVASLLRSLPAGHAPSEVVQVSMFQHLTTGDRVLGLTLSPPPGYTPVTSAPIEGLLMVDPNPDTVPFRMYQHPITGDRVSDVVAPAGYAEVRLLGHILIAQ